MRRKALITGVLGQDGAYLARLLLEKDYEVLGAARRSATQSPWRLEYLGIADKFPLVPLELLEQGNIMRLLKDFMPDEVYNLGAQSFVGTSFEQPLYTGDVDGLGVLRILEAIRVICPDARFYQASTSEMYGNIGGKSQNELTPLHPRSPYGVAKLFGHWITVNYREAYGMHATSGILFNHESPLRGTEFVTRKITLGLAKLARGGTAPIEVGNLEARRDWGFAGDYVQGMWQMLQADKPDDYVLATGVTTTVRRFAEIAADAAGFSIEWEGENEASVGIDRPTGRRLIQVNPAFYRPAEIDMLQGDAAKAWERLGWKPATSVEDLARMMMQADLMRTGT